MKNKGKKIVALLLAFCMMIGGISPVATTTVAAEGSTDPAYMIYLESVTTQPGKVFGTLAQGLETNTQYTVSFRCKVTEGKFDNAGTDSVFLRVRKEGMTGTTLCEGHVATGGTKGFDSYELDADGYTRRYTFTTDSTSTNYGINFEFNKAMKMYIADFKVYKTADPAKTTVLDIDGDTRMLALDNPTDRVAGEYGWDADYPTTATYNDYWDMLTCGNDSGTFYTATLQEYDATNVFIPLLPEGAKMIHINSTTTDAGKVFGMLAQGLETGTQYTISFKCKVKSGSFNNEGADTVYLRVRKDKMRSGTTLYESHVALDAATGFDSYELDEDGYTRRYTFTTDSSSTDYGINFEYRSAMEMYIADFKIYKTSDAAKKNVLPVEENGGALTTNVDPNRTPGIAGWDSDYPKNVTYNDIQTKMTYSNDNGTFYTAELMMYDAETVFVPFLPAGPKMLHINSLTTQTGKVLGMLAQGLEQNTQYTISFKCKVVSGSFANNSNDSVYLRVRRNAMQGGTANATVAVAHETPGISGGFDSYELDEDGYTRRYTFTTVSDAVNYAINFEFRGIMDMYIADFKVYKTDDAMMTNVLPLKENGRLLTTKTDTSRTAGAFGWDADYPTLVTYSDDRTLMTFANSSATFYTVELMMYDSETIFIPALPAGHKMIYINATPTSSGKPLGILAQNLKTNTQYTISFQCKVTEGSFANAGTDDVYLKVRKNKINGGSTLCQAHVAAGTSGGFDSYERGEDGYTRKYTFTTASDAVNYAISFEFNRAMKMYIADFKVYETADQTETNVLPLKANGSSLNTSGASSRVAGSAGWDADWPSLVTFSDLRDEMSYQSNYTAKLMMYDAANIFIPYEKQMLHVLHRGASVDDLLQNVTLEKGKTYTVSYKYKVVTGYPDYSVYFVVANGQPAGMNKVYYHQSQKDNFDKVTYGTEWCEVTYQFTLNDSRLESGKNACSVGFQFENRVGCSTELYIADMVLYETNATTQKNLLSTPDLGNGMHGWHNMWHSADSEIFKEGDYVAQYVPYVESYFRNVGYGDANEDAYVNVKDLIKLKKLIKAGEYSQYADSNRDGAITDADLTAVRKHIVDLQKIQTLVTPSKLLRGGADRQAKALKANIAGRQDYVKSSATGTIYYVDSVNGNDSNAGTSESKPKKTIAAVNQLTLNEGDAVLFKRGSVFRTAEALKVCTGVQYGAYGTGDKPIISGSLKDYGNVAWSATGTDGVWRLSETVSGQAGVVTFDGDTAIGNRVLSLNKLRKNGDFYHDYNGDGSFYLYLKGANPKDYFNRIEIGTTEYLLRGQWQDADGKYARKNVTIENLAIQYCSNTAMDFAHSNHITIKGCEFSWIGGAYNESGDICYGNAITLWRDNSDITVYQCSFYQIYDAAVTFQGNKPNYTSTEPYTEYINLKFDQLLIEYSSMNFEYWGSNSKLWETEGNESLKPQTIMRNISFTNSIVRFGGYGYGGINRASKSSQGCMLGWNFTYYDTDTIENFNIQNNIFDKSDCYIFYSPESLNSRMTISGNTYYQGKSSYRVNHDNEAIATDQASLVQAIETFEQNHGVVTWIE